MNEAHCISQIKKGESAAFRELFDHFRDRVFNTGLSLLQNREDAEDVSQEVFMAVYQSIGQFRGSSTLTTWIYRIAVQKSLEHIRSSQRKKRSGIMLSLLWKKDQIQVFASSPFYHPGIKLENKERAVILFQAIRRLPVNQRLAFTLHKMEDLSYAEITKILNISLPAVESLMFRAKHNLKKLLAEYYEKNEK